MKTKRLTLRTFIAENLLDQRHIAQARSELQCAYVNIHHTLWTSLHAAQEAARARAQAFDVRFNAGRAQIHGDGHRLGEVFNSLLAASLQWSRPGGTIIVGSENRGERLVVALSVNGAALPGELWPRGWGDLSTEEPTPLDRFGGRGLALTVSMVTVAAHDGQLSLHRHARGPGALFLVTLPLPKTAPLS